MPRSNVPSRPRSYTHIWPRVAVLAMVGVAGASCSDSARFDSNPYASNRQAPQETTGSIASRPASRGHVEAQPLPAPSRPATVSANGTASGAQGLGAYRPGSGYSSDITGTVPARTPPKPAGAWTWDGGSPVTVGYGETVEMVAKKYGVPVSALMETNGITNAASVKPGQRLVIPRYVSSSTPQAPAAKTAESVHIVAPGESLMGIAHHHGIALTAL